jgi:hypothetical protein
LYTSLRIDALLEHLVLVDVDEQLRHGRPEGGRNAGEFGALSRGFDELGGVLGEEGDVLAGTVLKNEGRAARGADPLDGRWRKRKGDGAGDAAKPLGQLGLDRGVLLFGLLAFAQFLSVMKKKAL